MSRAPKDFYDIETADGRVKRLVRVTTVCKGVGDKEPLLNWVAKTEKEAAIAGAAKYFGSIDPKERFGVGVLAYEMGLRAFLGEGRSNERTSDGAKLIGNEAHKRMEWIVKGRVGPEPQIGEEAAIAVNAGEQFLAQNPIEMVMSEQTVWSEKHEYAGTLDMLATFDGKLTVVDWKTSKAIYPEARLQVAAYAIAVDEMGHGPVEEGLILRLPKTTVDPGFEPIVIAGQDLTDAKEAFLAALTCWKWLHGQKVAYAKGRAA